MSRLERFVARTEAPLDALALCTIWIVFAPIVTWGRDGTHGWILAARLTLSALYTADYLIRIALAERHAAYARQNWLLGVAAIFPPVRVLFSVRLLGKLFKRGNLVYFLVTSAVFVANLALVTYFFETEEPHATITTVGDALWWALVTVTTVGYGDYTPVSLGGRITGGFVMATGIVVLAVVTAQVAASFVAQHAPRHPEPEASRRIADLEAEVEHLRQELDRRHP